jgi:hypothetical protein
MKTDLFEDTFSPQRILAVQKDTLRLLVMKVMANYMTKALFIENGRVKCVITFDKIRNDSTISADYPLTAVRDAILETIPGFESQGWEVIINSGAGQSMVNIVLYEAKAFTVKEKQNDD